MHLLNLWLALTLEVRGFQPFGGFRVEQLAKKSGCVWMKRRCSYWQNLKVGEVLRTSHKSSNWWLATFRAVSLWSLRQELMELIYEHVTYLHFRSIILGIWFTALGLVKLYLLYLSEDPEKFWKRFQLKRISYDSHKYCPWREFCFPYIFLFHMNKKYLGWSHSMVADTQSFALYGVYLLWSIFTIKPPFRADVLIVQ